MRSTLPKEIKDYCEDIGLDVLMVENETIGKTTIEKTIYLYCRELQEMEIHTLIMNDKGKQLNKGFYIRVKVNSLKTALNRIKVRENSDNGKVTDTFEP